MYVDRSRSGGTKRSVKDRLGGGGGGGCGVGSSSNFDQQEALKRQRQDHGKRNPSDKKIEEKMIVRKVVQATVKKDPPGSSKNATRSSITEMPETVLNMPKPRGLNAGSVKVSDIEGVLKRQQTNVGLTGGSDVKSVSIGQPKVGDPPAISNMEVKSGVRLFSAKRPAIQSRPALPIEQKQQNLVEELDVTSFLQSLGLSKYVITFKVEEVDMFALQHMNDHDLKEIGLPMGPRKKILLGLASARTKK